MANPELEEMLARASAAIGAMAELSEGYAAIVGEGSDVRSRVTARVDGSGALIGLDLDPAAMRSGAVELGELIVSSAMVAAQRAYAQRATLTEQFNRDFGELAGIATNETNEGDR
jgi:DNA-binding protein YbaB